MSKRNSEALFRLIKSMKPSEKRYFRLRFQEDASGLKYLQLFDYMDQQDEADDQAILSDLPRIARGQLSNLKSHLYTRLMQCLRQYSQPSVSDIQIREMIDHAQILYNRSLYDQCADMLLKAQRKAAKTDNLELQLEILKWKKNVLTQTVGPGNEQRVNGLIQDVREVNERINMINKFTNLGVKLNSMFFRTGFISNQEEFDRIRKIYRDGMPEYVEDKLSLNEKLSLYQVEAGYFHYIQDFNAGLESATKWVALFDEFPDLRYSRTDTYLTAINSMMIAQNKLYLYNAFVENTRRLREIRHYPSSVINDNIRMRLFKYTYVHEFNRIFMLGDFAHGVSLMKKIEHQMEEFIRFLDGHSRLILYYKVACLYFGDQKYGLAIQWLNRILNSDAVDIREDIHSFARILNLISHYELGNMDVIDYYIRSTYRFLLRKDDLKQFQRSILDFLKSMNSSVSEAELIQAFRSLRDKLILLRENPYEKRAFIYFDIISWLESKIQSRPVAEVISSKAEYIIHEHVEL